MIQTNMCFLKLCPKQMKTESLNKQSLDPKWYVVDADGQILGRFASKLADRLRGKDKPTFTPHTDGGDFVVVILSLIHI